MQCQTWFCSLCEWVTVTQACLEMLLSPYWTHSSPTTVCCVLTRDFSSDLSRHSLRNVSFTLFYSAFLIFSLLLPSFSPGCRVDNNSSVLLYCVFPYKGMCYWTRVCAGGQWPLAVFVKMSSILITSSHPSSLILEPLYSKIKQPAWNIHPFFKQYTFYL